MYYTAAPLKCRSKAIHFRFSYTKIAALPSQLTQYGASIMRGLVYSSLDCRSEVISNQIDGLFDPVYRWSVDFSF